MYCRILKNAKGFIRHHVHAYLHQKVATGAIIWEGDRKFWDLRASMIVEFFSIFRTNCVILTSFSALFPSSFVGSRVVVVTFRDQMVRNPRFSCGFFTAIAENKAGKKTSGSAMYFYTLS